MWYEAALIWVLLSAGYWGLHLLRRRAYPSPVLPWMMIGAAVASALGLLGRGGDDRVLEIAGAVGLGAGVCLMLVGPLARRLARTANGAERWRLARAAYEVAEVLQPATGVREEKRLAAAFARIHTGDSDEAVQALARLRNGAPPAARRALDEHITMIYLTAWRWRDAIAYAEASFFGARAATPPAAPSAPSAPSASVPGAAQDGEVQDGKVSAQDASASVGALPRAFPGAVLPLGGVSPPLWGELIGAYARDGQLAQAAAMLEELEQTVGAAPAAAPLVHRARMMFLALCGHTRGVARLTEPRASRFLRRPARAYWRGVAAARAGDRVAARTHLQEAVRSSRGRRRRMSELELAAVEQSAEPARAVELPREAAVVAERVAEEPPPIWVPPPRPWMTYATCALVVVTALAVAALGDSTEVGTLVRAGALVHGLVADGQLWRLGTAVLLHVGGTHLAVNVLSLWVLGRLAEGMFGSLRAAALFCGCGLAGTVASYYLGPPGIAAGASGAIFGLLGAVLGELAMHRQRLAHARRTGMWGALLLVLGATVVLGLLVPGIDQWAHAGGVVFGALAGQALSPRHRAGRAAGPVAGLVITAFAGLVAWGAWSAAQLRFVDLALAGPAVRRHLEGLELAAPPRWQPSEGELVDPELSIVFVAHLVPPDALSASPSAGVPGPAASSSPAPSASPSSPSASPPSASPPSASPPSASPPRELVAYLIDRWHAGEPGRERARGLEPAGALTSTSVPLPEGWSGRELELVAADELTGPQRFRALSFAYPVDGGRGGVIVGSLVAPASLFVEGASALGAVVAGVRPRR